jgi:hypothetical protein
VDEKEQVWSVLAESKVLGLKSVLDSASRIMRAVSEFLEIA